MTQSPQYTPAQVLQAGRRAEAGGRPDYAIQFYRHLVDHHGATVEGAEARTSLDRITSATRRVGPEAQRAPLFPDPPAPPPQHQFDPPRPVAGQEPLARLALRSEPARTATRSMMDVEEADNEPGYGLGRACAGASTILGFLLLPIAAGLVAASFAKLEIGILAMDVAGFPLAIMLAPAATVLGLMMILAGQSARAVFDHADALQAHIDRQSRTK